MKQGKTIGGNANAERQSAYLAYRIRMLPDQLDRAYRRVRQLETEAISLNMQDLIRRD